MARGAPKGNQIDRSSHLLLVLTPDKVKLFILDTLSYHFRQPDLDNALRKRLLELYGRLQNHTD